MDEEGESEGNGLAVPADCMSYKSFSAPWIGRLGWIFNESRSTHFVPLPRT